MIGALQSLAPIDTHLNVGYSNVSIPDVSIFLSTFAIYCILSGFPKRPKMK